MQELDRGGGQRHRAGCRRGVEDRPLERGYSIAARRPRGVVQVRRWISQEVRPQGRTPEVIGRIHPRPGGGLVQQGVVGGGRRRTFRRSGCVVPAHGVLGDQSTGVVEDRCGFHPLAGARHLDGTVVGRYRRGRRPPADSISSGAAGSRPPVQRYSRTTRRVTGHRWQRGKVSLPRNVERAVEVDIVEHGVEPSCRPARGPESPLGRRVRAIGAFAFAVPDQAAGGRPTSREGTRSRPKPAPPPRPTPTSTPTPVASVSNRTRVISAPFQRYRSTELPLRPQWSQRTS